MWVRGVKVGEGGECEKEGWVRRVGQRGEGGLEGRVRGVNEGEGGGLGGRRWDERLQKRGA